MARFRDFDPLDQFPAWVADALQETLTGHLAALVRIKPTDATRVQLNAGAGDARAVAVIDGRWRWVDAPIERAASGAARALDVHITASDDVTSTQPLVVDGVTYPTERDDTDRSFGLAITETGQTPAGVALSSRIATATWDGSKFIDLQQIGGIFPLDVWQFTSALRARIPTQTENDALVGTTGTPSNTNRYATASHPRLRVPRVGAATRGDAGGDVTAQSITLKTNALGFTPDDAWGVHVRADFTVLAANVEIYVVMIVDNALQEDTRQKIGVPGFIGVHVHLEKDFAPGVLDTRGYQFGFALATVDSSKTLTLRNTSDEHYLVQAHEF